MATPGILDYSRAIIIYIVKTAPDDIHEIPGALQTWINKTLTETDHAHPDSEIVAIACGEQHREKNGVRHLCEVQQQPETSAKPLAAVKKKTGAVATAADITGSPQLAEAIAADAEVRSLGKGCSAVDCLSTFSGQITKLENSDQMPSDAGTKQEVAVAARTGTDFIATADILDKELAQSDNLSVWRQVSLGL